MARITVEDCLQKVPNRFELIVLAAQRARSLARGEPRTIDDYRSKNPVMALREIGEGTLEPEALKEALIDHIQQAVITEPDDREDEPVDLIDLSSTQLHPSAFEMPSLEETIAGMGAQPDVPPIEALSAEEIEDAIVRELSGAL